MKKYSQDLGSSCEQTEGLSAKTYLLAFTRLLSSANTMQNGGVQSPFTETKQKANKSSMEHCKMSELLLQLVAKQMYQTLKEWMGPFSSQF